MIIWCKCMFLFYICMSTKAQDPALQLKQGRIVGIKVFTKNAVRPVEIFYGVPYATAPVGRYRFAAPEPHPGWKRTLYAHRIPPRCPQADASTSNINEDCLYLNIWTTRSADGNSLPVIVILQSESWLQGGISLPCEDLAAEGAVVVTVSYRLHLLAFFTLKSPLARGNLALLDQYLALLWVNENIAAFGGDPASISVLGHATGADSVLYHLASPRSNGLFRRAIIMSPRDIWKILGQNVSIDASGAEKISRQYSHKLGCRGTSDEEILHCMRSRPLSDILSVYQISNWSALMQPYSDSFLPNTDQYLPITPAMALKSSKYPYYPIDLLIGSTDLDFINYNDIRFTNILDKGTSFIREYVYTEGISEILKMLSLYREDSLPMMLLAVYWEFFGSMSRDDFETDGLQAVEAFARMVSSSEWGAGGSLIARRITRRVSNLYMYQFSHPGGVDLYGRASNYSGAIHGTDLVTLFGDAMMIQVARRHETSMEKQLSYYLKRYFINFVKFGSPTDDGQWQKYNVSNPFVMKISMESRNVNTRHKEEEFWLRYLPQLSNDFSTCGYSEQLISEKGETKLRGGVFALSGVCVVLLLLLCACALLLHLERSRRSSLADMHN